MIEIVKGFWHVYLVNHWYSVVTDQLRILLSSGLYDRSEIIKIGCIGTVAERDLFLKLIIALYPKLSLEYFSTNPLEYEFPTLRLIQNDNSRYVGYYFHTKAVTRPSDTVINHWRAWLNESILNRWQGHYENVVGLYDVSSVNFIESPRHYSGNFWWFNRSYINKLINIDMLDHKNRFAAEQWICRYRKGNFFHKEFIEPGRDIFKIA